MKERIDRNIGSIFKYKGKLFQVVLGTKDLGCKDCYFHKQEKCPPLEVSNCDRLIRRDCKDVIFIEATEDLGKINQRNKYKLAEEYMLEGNNLSNETALDKFDIKCFTNFIFKLRDKYIIETIFCENYLKKWKEYRITNKI